VRIKSSLKDTPLTEGTFSLRPHRVLTKLNPFINLFDHRLHNVPYIRARSPFLFSVLMMAGCKFFRAEFYSTCLAIAHNFAHRALIDDWKSVEVVQAFACLTYWKEPDDTRTWTWIGYVRDPCLQISRSPDDRQLTNRVSPNHSHPVPFVPMAMAECKHERNIPNIGVSDGCRTRLKSLFSAARQGKFIAASGAEKSRADVPRALGA